MIATPANNGDNSSSVQNSSAFNTKGNDSNMFLVSNPLTGNENYMQWKYSIQIDFGAKRKAGFIDGTLKEPESVGAELDDWTSNTCMVRSWLLNAISNDIA